MDHQRPGPRRRRPGPPEADPATEHDPADREVERRRWPPDDAGEPEDGQRRSRPRSPPRAGRTPGSQSGGRRSTSAATLSSSLGTKAMGSGSRSRAPYAAASREDVSSTTGGSSSLEHPATDVEPVEVGQPDVEQDEVGVVLPAQRQRGRPVGGLGDHLEAAGDREGARHLAEAGVVVDDEHGSPHPANSRTPRPAHASGRTLSAVSERDRHAATRGARSRPGPTSASRARCELEALSTRLAPRRRPGPTAATRTSSTQPRSRHPRRVEHDRREHREDDRLASAASAHQRRQPAGVAAAHRVLAPRLARRRRPSWNTTTTAVASA